MSLNKEQIKEIIPYQEPFLFVDGVEEIGENTISGFYQTSKDDYYFQGHFVDFKIMPGVLVIEALAQLSTILLRKKISSIIKYILITLTIIFFILSCFYTLEIIPNNGSCGSGCNESGTFFKEFKWHPLDVTPIQKMNYKISNKY